MADDDVSTPMDLDKLASSSDSESEHEAAIESLVAGRSKRATAGNRMGAMIGEIAADDDLELLFAEDEEDGPDEEFEEEAEEAGSDNDLGDSSDDEDQGPTAGAEDLDGEKEIERQAKEERKRKRKAQRAFTKPSKKLKHAPFIGAASATAASPSTPVPKPAKKKVDRSSWVPNLGEATRTSRREATTLQSEALRTRIVKREKDRKEQMKKLEEKARRREANKPKALTQEDRLREAAEVEKENAKSLNRWEAIERERQEEQRARLEALQNRKLEGPVVTFWSGPARWIGDKLSAVGNDKVKKAEAGHTSKDSTSSDHEKEDEEGGDAGKSNETESSAQQPGERTAQGDLVGEEKKEPTADQPHNSIGTVIRPKSSGSTAAAQVTKGQTAPSVTPGPSNPQLLPGPSRSEAPSASPQPSVQPSSLGPSRSEAPSLSPQPSAHIPPLSATTSVSPQPTPQTQPSDPLTADTRAPNTAAPTAPPITTTTTAVASSTDPSSTSHFKSSSIKQEPSSNNTLIPHSSSVQPNGAQQIVFSLAPPPSSTSTSPQPPPSVSSSTATNPRPQLSASAPAASPSLPPGPPPKPVIAVRNLISVVNVDLSNPNSNTIPAELRGSVLIASSRPAKTSRRGGAAGTGVGRAKQTGTGATAATCTVTGLSVKYRDPRSGMEYANPYAYRQLNGVRDEKVKWTETENYLGKPSRVAAGVPEGFKVVKGKT